MQAIHHRIPLQVGVLVVRVTEVEEAGLDGLLEVPNDSGGRRGGRRGGGRRGR